MHRQRLLVLVSGLALAACGVNTEEADTLASVESGLGGGSAYYPGSTVTLGTGDNDASWFVNMSNSTWGETSKLTATITHGGLLTGSFGLDHLAIGIRGSSVDGTFQQMGLPLQTGTFLYGEQVQRAVSSGIVSESNLRRLLAGRGITLWAPGAPYCRDSTRPCIIFENYTTNASSDGLVCANGRNSCSGAVAVSLTSGSFGVSLSADDWDTWATVTQNGTTRANISCRAVSRTSALPNGDPRCGPQPGDAAYGDAFIANVIRGTASAGRSMGATNIRVDVKNVCGSCSSGYSCFCGDGVCRREGTICP